jgi:hypothetical protein
MIAAADALCRASRRGALGFDAQRLRGKNPPGLAPLAAPSRAAFFAGPERLPSPACPAPLAFAMRRRAPPPMSANLHDPRAQPEIACNPGARRRAGISR